MKIKIWTIIYTIFLLPFFVTTSIVSKNIITLLRVFSLLAFFIIFINSIKKKRICNKINFLIFLISIWITILSMYNHTINIEIIYYIYSWTSICFTTNTMLNDKNYDFLIIFCNMLNIFAILNIPFLISQYGLDAYNRVYIFGAKNTMQLFFIPALFVNYVVSMLKYNEIQKNYIFFMVLDILTMILCGSSTGILATIVFLIFITIGKKIHLNIFHYALIILLLLFLLFNTTYILKINFLKFIIVDILHKNLTFTGRTSIWTYVIPKIINNPLGYGYGNNIVNLQFPILHEAHNMFLELLLIGGFPLLCLYCLFIISLLKKNPNYNTNILLAMCFTFFIIGLTESVQFHPQFWITMIVYYKISNHILIFKNQNRQGVDSLETK